MFLVCVCLHQSNAAVEEWVRRYHGEPSAVAVDGAGTIFVTGFSGDANFATVAYTGAGIALWTNRYYKGPGNWGWGVAIAIDGSGKVFVAGASAFSHAADFVTIAYTTNGTPLWTNYFNGRGNDEDVARRLAVDTAGNVFVTGYSKYITNFWGGTAFGWQFATLSYSSTGTPRWTNYYEGPLGGVTIPYAVGMDSSGNAVVSGFSEGAIVTIAYSNAGVPLWTNRFEGASGTDLGMVIDESGRIFVSGAGTTLAYSNEGSLIWTNYSDGITTGMTMDKDGRLFICGPWSDGTSPYDYETIAYSTSGSPLWTNHFNGPGNLTDYATGVAVDSSGHVVVTGNSVDVGGLTDYATIGYSGNGIPLWTNRHSGGHAAAITADKNGNVFVVGSANSDYGIIKYFTGEVPVLTIHRTGLDVVLAWPSRFAEFVLQESVGFEAGGWVDVGTLTIDDGVTRRVSVPAGETSRFFRLRR